MTSTETSILIASIALVGGTGLGFWIHRWRMRGVQDALKSQEQGILDAAKREATSIVREARLKADEHLLAAHGETDRNYATRRHELSQVEQKLVEREALINRQFETIVQQENSIRDRKAQLHEQLERVDRLEKELASQTEKRRGALETISHLSVAEARALLLKDLQEEVTRDAGHLARHILEEAKSRAEEKARRIISTAIQRYAGQHTFETSTATVALTGDDIKGRIIGREGRNIRAFEAVTGVTVLIDDTPNAVVLSGFDPVRREIAREAMQRLILDGRIHPTRIEEVVVKVTEEMDETIVRLGDEAVGKVNLPPMHPEVVKLLGRLHFRRSFSQNILNHSIEVAQLMGLLAAELKIDVDSAKRAGLLHDIGKAVNHEIEGAHAIVGAEILKRYGESEPVVNGVAAHHDEVPHTGLLGILVSAADAISASRPGARSETMTTYIKRVEDLERVAASFQGVERAFAFQAGREIRVIVNPDEVTDEQAFVLARGIARKVEEELQYPGQIRVTVVRETRCIEFAK